MKKNLVCIAGIDTNTGKTIVTGGIAKALIEKGLSCISAKLIQTGAESDIAEDILIHRQIMGTGLFDADREGLTCPYVFKLAASPHLAAKEAGISIDKNHVIRSLKILQDSFDIVVAEAVGGLMVPWAGRYTTCDFLTENDIPVILVSSSRLGSINHTWLSMEIMRLRGIRVIGLVYNDYPKTDNRIADDSFSLFSSLWPDIPVVRLGFIHDFSFTQGVGYYEPLMPVIGKII